MIPSMGDPRQILVTGPPGVGKSTLITKVLERLRKDGVRVSGFYTTEQRASGIRTGFEVVDVVSGERGILATTAAGARGPSVGKYTVDVADFERVALPAIGASEAELVTLDELGKMESLSSAFVRQFRDFLASPNRPLLLATIPLSKGKPLAMVSEVSALPRTEIRHLTKANRDTEADYVYQLVKRLRD